MHGTSIEQMVDEIQEKLRDATGYGFNEAGVLRCKKWIREFGYDIVYDSVETSLYQYLIQDKSGNYTEDSIDMVFSKIGGIAKNKHNALTKPYISDAKRVINYAKKSFCITSSELNDLSADLNNLLYFFFTTNQYDDKVEFMLSLVRGSKDKYEFFEKIEETKEKYSIK